MASGKNSKILLIIRIKEKALRAAQLNTIEISLVHFFAFLKKRGGFSKVKHIRVPQKLSKLQQ
jgi:hypothetical protein